MSIENIAKITHDINKAYCESLGDQSQFTWEDAPQWHKDSVISGVKAYIDDPDLTPQQSHQNWFSIKINDGWVYGEVKDVDKKEHPCLVAYDQLPNEHRVKNAIFRQVVLSLKDKLTS